MVWLPSMSLFLNCEFTVINTTAKVSPYSQWENRSWIATWFLVTTWTLEVHMISGINTCLVFQQDFRMAVQIMDINTALCHIMSHGHHHSPR